MRARCVANSVMLNNTVTFGRIIFGNEFLSPNVSKDTGFDPLLQHLKSKKVSASRVTSISGLPMVKVAASKSTPDRVAAVIANLAKSGAAKAANSQNPCQCSKCAVSEVAH